MKLLLIADLHLHIDRFRWLIKQAPNYDLVCIVGDLLDMFCSDWGVCQSRQYQGQISDTACFPSGFRTWESSAGLVQVKAEEGKGK